MDGVVCNGFTGCLYFVTNHLMLNVCIMMLSSPTVKPGSSGPSQMAPSPSLCLSPSWRGPSGKSSSLRLSTKKQTGTIQTALSLAFLLPTSPGSFPDHRKALPPPVELLWQFLLLHHFPSSSCSRPSALRPQTMSPKHSCCCSSVRTIVIIFIFFVATISLPPFSSRKFRNLCPTIQQMGQYWSLEHRPNRDLLNI